MTLMEVASGERVVRCPQSEILMVVVRRPRTICLAIQHRSGRCPRPNLRGRRGSLFISHRPLDGMRADLIAAFNALSGPTSRAAASKRMRSSARWSSLSTIACICSARGAKCDVSHEAPEELRFFLAPYGLGIEEAHSSDP